MEQTIIVTAALQERFQAAWAQRQVILFCAPCGCGKSAAALLLLEPYTICRWDALESAPPEPPRTLSGTTGLIQPGQPLPPLPGKEEPAPQPAPQPAPSAADPKADAMAEVVRRVLRGLS